MNRNTECREIDPNFCFFSLGQGGVRGDVWVDSIGNGAKLRVAGLSPMEPARNLWQVISTASLVATKLEKWKT